jgi:hypothetical protein
MKTSYSNGSNDDVRRDEQAKRDFKHSAAVAAPCHPQ